MKSCVNLGLIMTIPLWCYNIKGPKWYATQKPILAQKSPKSILGLHAQHFTMHHLVIMSWFALSVKEDGKGLKIEYSLSDKNDISNMKYICMSALWPSACRHLPYLKLSLTPTHVT